MYKIKKICEVCDSKYQFKFLNLGLQPLCDDLIKIGSKKKNKKYKTELSFCKKCLTVHQLKSVDKKILFPKTYHYRSRFTDDVVSGMKDFVIKTDKLVKCKKKVVLDIGCNDGTLLDLYKKRNYLTLGVEPTNASKEAKNKNHLIFQEYFSEELAHKINKIYSFISLIVFTNVFAHIDNLNELIRNLKIIFKNNTILVIENHYLGDIIKKFQFDSFYHEHPRTYSLSSFKFIAKKLNGEVFKVEYPKRYSGNIRVYIKNKNNISIKTRKFKYIKEINFFKSLKRFQSKVNSWVLYKRNQFKDLKSKYKTLYGKAFPGRASILINLLKINEKIISATYEKNGSKKINRYVPGTKIKILNDNKLKFLKDNKIIINFAWHISKEIKKYLISKKYNFRIINLFDEKDIMECKKINKVKYSLNI